MALQPFPKADHQREARIVQDIADLLHEPQPSESTVRKVKRWLAFVLADAASRRKWWFLENAATKTLELGQDIIDLVGHIDKAIAVYAPARLTKIPLQQMVELRMRAQMSNRPNAGPPTHYALEAGRRLHLWPAPLDDTAFALVYSRPMHPAIVPNAAWESLLVNGILGRYGQHFDRDALSQNPEAFERRYEEDLRRQGVDSWDIERIPRWDDIVDGQTTAAANSSTDTAVESIVPASLTGIGFVTIETGPYPLEVAED